MEKKKLELLLERNKGNREFALAAEKEIRIGGKEGGGKDVTNT